MRTYYKDEDGKQVLDFEGETLYFDEPLENLSDLMAPNTVLANALFISTSKRPNNEVLTE